MPELTVEWRSVAKEPPPAGETVLVWFKGRPAVGLYRPQGHGSRVHDWLIYPAGECPMSPFPQHQPKWWTAMIAAPSDEPVAWGPPTDFGEIHVVWRGSVTDLYTDLFPLLTPPQLSELGRKLIGQPGGHVDRMREAASSKPQAASSENCSHCQSPDGNCPWHRADTELLGRVRAALQRFGTPYRKLLEVEAVVFGTERLKTVQLSPESRKAALLEVLGSCHSISEFVDELKAAFEGDRWNAVQYEASRKPLPPVPMLLRCPSCNERHIDEGEFATKPHHTHACQICGEVWRPAIVNTVGVHFLPGFKNSRAAASEPPGSVERDILLRVRELIDRVMGDDHAPRGELKIAEELDGFVPARKS